MCPFAVGLVVNADGELIDRCADSKGFGFSCWISSAVYLQAPAMKIDCMCFSIRSKLLEDASSLWQPLKYYPKSILEPAVASPLAELI